MLNFIYPNYNLIDNNNSDVSVQFQIYTGSDNGQRL
jgi:hypothetical protein